MYEPDQCPECKAEDPTVDLDGHCTDCGELIDPRAIAQAREEEALEEHGH